MTTAPHPNVNQDTVYALAQSVHHLYAARASGLYRSQDEGATWQNLFDSLHLPKTQTAAAVAVAGNTVFAGVKGAVLRSEDAGESWHIAGLSSPPPLVVALAVSPSYAADGIILAATAEDGVFVSNDRGKTWTAWNFGLVDLHVYALVISPAFSGDGIVFAGTESGIFRSHTGGRSWRETPFPMEAAPVLSLALSLDYETDGRVYAGTEGSGLFVSDDFGTNWRQIENDLISMPVNAIHIPTLSTSEVCLLLEDKLLWSADRGKSWALHTQSIPSGKAAMALLLNASSPGAVLVGCADGDILHLY